MKYDLKWEDMTISELADYVDHRPLSEMEKLILLLDSEGIPYKKDGNNWLGISYKGEYYTVVLSDFSYGHERNLLEINNWNWDDVIGWCGGADIFEIIISDIESICESDIVFFDEGYYYNREYDTWDYFDGVEWSWDYA